MCAARDWQWWGREEDGFPRGDLRHCYGDRGGRSSPASCRLSSAPLRWPSAQLLAQCRSPPDRSCPVVCTQTFSPLPPGPPLLTRNTAFVLVSLSQVRLHGMQIDVHRERIAGRQVKRGHAAGGSAGGQARTAQVVHALGFETPCAKWGTPPP